MEAILNHLFRKQYILIISSLLHFFTLSGQDTVKIYGQRTDWANKTIEVWYYADYISKIQTEVAKINMSDSGHFSIAFPLKNTRQIYIYSGGIEGTLYAEPGHEYDLNLPKYREMTKVDSLNPFYQPYKIYFGLNNSHALELNHLLSEFDILYNDYLAANFRQIRRGGRYSGVDTMIMFMDSLFEKAEQNPYFKAYKKYKTAELRRISYIHDDNYIIRDYYLNEPVLYTNTSYFELFNKIFDNYIEYYSTTRDGQDIAFDIVRAKSYQRAMKTLANNLALRNDTLRELVLMKGLNDALYKNTFPKSSLFQTLDSVRLQTSIPGHKKIAKRITEKAKMLRAGFPPPEFTIEMGDTLQYGFPPKGEKFVLLNFIDIESFAVQKVLPQLKNLQEKHKQVLKIVSVSVGGKYSKARKVFNENGYKWLLLNGKGLDKVLDNYKVKAYPSFYLITPEGNLALNPTPGPDDHFEWYFFKLLKKRERQNYRRR